ncbi:MAG: hypothetical protein HC829_09140 [Bacteroidales bacterium]|nr:hypothetical protein [Synechococcaceae cyanobacterium SM2_3_2]NJO54959.1 hypothetical protein [Bacteroidales bacterium]
MKIAWEPCIYGVQTPVPCVICGQRSAPTATRGQQAMLAVVYDHEGRIFGEACRSCVRLGADGIRAYLQERIATLQSQVQDLQHLNQGEISLPSLEEELRVYLE